MHIEIKVRGERAIDVKWSGGATGGKYAIEVHDRRFQNLADDLNGDLSDRDFYVMTSFGQSSDPGNVDVVGSKVYQFVEHQNIVGGEDFMEATTIGKVPERDDEPPPINDEVRY